MHTFFSNTQPHISGNQNWELHALILQLEGTNLKDYLTTVSKATYYYGLVCPCCGAPHDLHRHGVYERYLIVFVLGKLVYQSIPIIRVVCRSCSTTHALLPADVVAYCQYSLSVLLSIFIQILLASVSVPQVAQRYELPVWSVYLVLRRYEWCQARIGLVLFELGYLPKDHQRFTAQESLALIQQHGLNRFIRQYWQSNGRYLWQTRFHNRASPPVFLGWQNIGVNLSHNP